MQDSTLKYKDEVDRSLGLAGTAIAMVVWNGEDKLTEISLDSAPGEGLRLSPDFDFGGNPRLSARLAWQLMYEQLRLTSAMVMGNVMCRSYIGQGRPVSSAVRARLRALVHDEAVQTCSLDTDESDSLFRQIDDVMQQLFTHGAVVQMASEFADALRQRRTLSVAEVLDRLDRLPRASRSF